MTLKQVPRGVSFEKNVVRTKSFGWLSMLEDSSKRLRYEISGDALVTECCDPPEIKHFQEHELGGRKVPLGMGPASHKL